MDLSFLDQATSHVKPLSRPPTEPNVAITISHLLSLGLLSLSTIQKDAFHAAMVVLQSASLDPEVGTFLSRVIHCAPELFSFIDHVVKENAQAIFGEIEREKT